MEEIEKKIEGIQGLISIRQRAVVKLLTCGEGIELIDVYNQLESMVQKQEVLISDLCRQLVELRKETNEMPKMQFQPHAQPKAGNNR